MNNSNYSKLGDQMEDLGKTEFSLEKGWLNSALFVY